jgi:PadR family transcriptional regulator PadR
MLGELEQVVLLAILQSGDDAYGVTIRREIQDRTKRDFTLGTVYKTLARLEDKGLVTSFTGEPTPERGGRRKRYYRVSALGRRSLRTALSALRTMTVGLDLGLEAP